MQGFKIWFTITILSTKLRIFHSLISRTFVLRTKTQDKRFNSNQRIHLHGDREQAKIIKKKWSRLAITSIKFGEIKWENSKLAGVCVKQWKYWKENLQKRLNLDWKDEKPRRVEGRRRDWTKNKRQSNGKQILPEVSMSQFHFINSNAFFWFWRNWKKRNNLDWIGLDWITSRKQGRPMLIAIHLTSTFTFQVTCFIYLFYFLITPSPN